MDKNELERLKEIARLKLASVDRDPFLHELVKDTSEKMHLPTVVVSVVLNDAQHFVASHGLGGWLLNAGGTPVEWSFCRFVVKDKKPFVVPNAAQHPRVKDSPLVTQEGIRCYAGVPLVTDRGHVVGTLCVAGSEQHEFKPTELETLHAIAKRVMQHLEERAKTA